VSLASRSGQQRSGRRARGVTVGPAAAPEPDTAKITLFVQVALDESAANEPPPASQVTDVWGAARGRPPPASLWLPERSSVPIGLAFLVKT
jgi:hypothetical protein